MSWRQMSRGPQILAANRNRYPEPQLRARTGGIEDGCFGSTALKKYTTRFGGRCRPCPMWGLPWSRGVIMGNQVRKDHVDGCWLPWTAHIRSVLLDGTDLVQLGKRARGGFQADNQDLYFRILAFGYIFRQGQYPSSLVLSGPYQMGAGLPCE